MRPEGAIDPDERVIDPTKWFRLERLTVATPVEPEMKVIDVGVIVKPKSSTTTCKLTTSTRVSGLLEASVVAYVPDTTAV